jgi:general secretion pathway protein A
LNSCAISLAISDCRSAGQAKDELIHLLNGFLLQRHQKGLTTILVVDEAHHLSPEILEEIRLLTNLETSQRKLLQIVLAGQPELDQKLDSHRTAATEAADRAALPSRAAQCERNPGVHARRLRIAGAPAAVEIFSKPAIEAVFSHSRGIPRLINTICENALLAGYAKHAATITSEIIEGVARDLRLGVVVAEPKGNGGVHLSQRAGAERAPCWR